MYDCEICGRATEKAYVVEIEGARMSLCEKCAKGKSPIQVLGEAKPEHAAGRVKANASEELELVSDYGKRVRAAREAMGMPPKVLAERINEKESTLVRVENQRMLPDETLRRKLEKELGIKLMEKTEKRNAGTGSGANVPLTLWDAALKKEKEKKQ